MRSSTALRLVGADARSLLHRISTNAVGDLAPGQARATLFCDFRGRLLHRAVVAMTADGAVWLLRDDAPGVPLAAFLDRHVFRDDVRIEDLSERLSVRRTAEDLSLAPGTTVEQAGVPAAVRAEGDDVLRVGAATADLGRGAPPEDAATADLAAGTPLDDATAAERARVRAGRPAHGHEIVDAFTPFEAGLAHEVHLDKGCFTGQEALMRLVTYRSVRRRLARVRGAGPAPAVPAKLRAGGEPAGVLTTAVTEGGGWIGLAVLRHEVCEPPQALEIAGGGSLGPPEPLSLTRPQGRP